MTKTHQDLFLNHKRLGHSHFSVLQKVLHHLHVPVHHLQHSDLFCEPCQLGKLHHITFPSIPLKTSKQLQLVHSNKWGHTPYTSPESYVTIFVLLMILQHLHCFILYALSLMQQLLFLLSLRWLSDNWTLSYYAVKLILAVNKGKLFLSCNLQELRSIIHVFTHINNRARQNENIAI